MFWKYEMTKKIILLLIIVRIIRLVKIMLSLKCAIFLHNFSLKHFLLQLIFRALWMSCGSCTVKKVYRYSYGSIVFVLL